MLNLLILGNKSIAQIAFTFKPKYEYVQHIIYYVVSTLRTSGKTYKDALLPPQSTVSKYYHRVQYVVRTLSIATPSISYP